MQRGQEGVEGAVVGADAVSGSGSGTEMDGDGTGNMDGAMEGDELVKWACSDEGCAAIQQYVSDPHPCQQGPYTSKPLASTTPPGKESKLESRLMSISWKAVPSPTAPYRLFHFLSSQL